MRFRLTAVLLTLLFINVAFPQIVTTVPALPTENDSIVVYFDATQPGASALLNYTGDIYAHTGVTTNVDKWRYVMAPWASNYPETKLIRDSANHYHLVIGYPRIYYSNNHQNLGAIPSSEHITALDFVFRSADGSKQTSPDIFVPLYQVGLKVKVVSPVAPYFTNLNNNVNVEITSSGAKSVSIFINDSLYIQTASSDTTFNIIASNYGNTWIKAVAYDQNGGTKTDSSYFVVNPAINIQPLPNGIVDGINYIGNSSVVLSLYAPQKKNVYVIGDFNNWVVDPSYYMKQTPDGSRWWIEIDNLTPQKEYIFQYLVDGTLRIADPYSEKISDPNSDAQIPDSTYPNLIKYPSDKTTEIASVLQTDQTPYQWHDSGFNKPAKTNLVIYELLIRDFLASHNYKTLADTLSYLKNLGINAIELMPIMNFEGNDSWGYNPNFFDAPDKSYGPKNDLKGFIDKAHQMGIAVILDIPFNDAFGSCPLVRLYWDSANNRPAADNPWFNQSATHPYNVGYDFNHTSPATHYFVDATTKFWLTQYHVDGFRFDLAGGYTQTNNPNNASAWESFDQSRINNEERIADAIWKVSPDAYVILEEFVANSEEKVVTDYGMMVWDNQNTAYAQAAMGYAINPSWDISGISYKQWGWTEPGLVGYMESHDEERLMYKNLQYGNTDSASYNVKNLSTALNRIKLCEALFYTIPGPKMLWQFGELGYDYSINYNSRIGDKPIRWDYYDVPERLSLYKTTAALIKLKLNYPAFESTAFTTDLSGAIKRIYISDPSMNVAVIGNFDMYAHNVDPSFASGGTWYDYFSGDSLVTPNGHGDIILNAGDFHIYTSVKLPLPDLQVPTGINEGSSSVIKSYNLEQNYPNPFNPSTTIKYQIPQSGLVTLKIYDVLGREVKTLINGYKQSGTYQITFNGNGLASGIYFYRLDANNFISVKKMILMK